MGAVGEDVGDVRVGVRRLLDPPVDAEDKVGEGAVGPQALVAPRLALGVVVDDASDDLPVAVVPLRRLAVFGEAGGGRERRDDGEERARENRLHRVTLCDGTGPSTQAKEEYP